MQPLPDSIIHPCCRQLHPKSDPHFFLLYRIPSFLFGMTCAYWIKNSVSNKYYYYILLAGIPFFIYLFPHHHEIYNYKYLSTVFLIPLFTFLFVVISKHLPPINPVFSKIGQASLEIYIIQGMFFHAVLTDMISIPAEYHDIISILFMILSSYLRYFCPLANRQNRNYPDFLNRLL